jgi:homocysteine S-methyltransferase
MDRGLNREEAEEVFRRAVALAVEARDDFWSDPGNRGGRLRPLVAGSVGPYGAFLADGSEYTGDYGLSRRELRDFHEPRWRLLAGSGVDLLACETIPSGVEAEVLLDLLADSPYTWAWLSLQCRDAAHLADGTPLHRITDACDGAAGLVALGANCVPPSLVVPLAEALADAHSVPVAAYPNSGERYDATRKEWGPGEALSGLHAEVPAWLQAGVRVVGGCCRVSPEQIRAMRGAALAGAEDES